MQNEESTCTNQQKLIDLKRQLDQIQTVSLPPQYPYWVISVALISELQMAISNIEYLNRQNRGDYNANLIQRFENNVPILKQGLRQHKDYFLVDKTLRKKIRQLTNGTSISFIKNHNYIGRNLIYSHKIQYFVYSHHNITNPDSQLIFDSLYCLPDILLQEISIKIMDKKFPIQLYPSYRYQTWIYVGQKPAISSQVQVKLKKNQIFKLSNFYQSVQLFKLIKRFNKFTLMIQVYQQKSILKPPQMFCSNHPNLQVNYYCLCLHKKINACSPQCFLSNKKHTKKCIYMQKKDYSLQQAVSKVQFEQNGGLMGLYNELNMCFFNAVIQCLSHTKILTKYFLDNRQIKDICFWNKDSTFGQIALSYGELIKKIWSKTALQRDNMDLYLIIGRWNTAYSHGQQQDAHEFLCKILDWLKQDLNLNQRKINYRNIQNEGIPQQDLYLQTSQYFKQRNQSIIQHSMQGILRSTIQCLICQNKSITFDTFLNLQLPIPKPSVVQVPYKVIHVYYIPFSAYQSIMKYRLYMSQQDTLDTFKSKIRSYRTKFSSYNIAVYISTCDKGIKIINSKNFVDLFSLQPGQQIFCIQKYPIGLENTFVQCVLNFIPNQSNSIRQFQRPIYLRKNMEISRLYLSILQSLYRRICSDGHHDSFFYKKIQTQQFPFQLSICTDDSQRRLPRKKPQSSQKIQIQKGMQVKLYIGINQKFKFQKLNNYTRHASCNQDQPKAKTTTTLELKLQNCLDLYCKQQQLEQREWRCGTCQKLQHATKTIRFKKLPPVLILSLNRFKQQTNYMNQHRIYTKNQKMIKYQQQLNMSRYICEQSDARYRLYAVVNHIKLDSYSENVNDLAGHYHSYIRRSQLWYKFDDQRIKVINKEVVLTSPNAYLLFYEKISQ